MINTKDVIRMKVPYPDISSGLAVSAHMYICKDSTLTNDYSFIKCQSLKPYMIIDNPMNNYCDEVPDATRNPFTGPTRIDCDKLFKVSGVTFSDTMKTTIRTDVCDDLYNEVIKKLSIGECHNEDIDKNDLVSLNPSVSII